DERGKNWPCGAAAKVALRRLIRARAVVCDLPEPGEQKSFTARCAVSGTDLSTWMVRQGWAKPNDPPEPALADAAEAAKSERIGLWRGPSTVRYGRVFRTAFKDPSVPNFYRPIKYPQPRLRD